uniref:Uncharacterized protein n=1 Tax=Arundo donax TaxID=35708 RepID=A0A0A8Z3U4_ARUDO
MRLNIISHFKLKQQHYFYSKRNGRLMYMPLRKWIFSEKWGIQMVLTTLVCLMWPVVLHSLTSQLNKSSSCNSMHQTYGLIDTPCALRKQISVSVYDLAA